MNSNSFEDDAISDSDEEFNIEKHEYEMYERYQYRNDGYNNAVLLYMTNRIRDRIRAEKGKTFDMIVNELISHYQKIQKDYKKDYTTWKKGNVAWKKRDNEYDLLLDNHKKNLKNNQKVYKDLLKWAKSKGFKG